MSGVDYNGADELDPDHLVRRGVTDYSGLRALAAVSGEDTLVNGDDTSSVAPIVLLAGHVVSFDDGEGNIASIGVSEGVASAASGLSNFYAPNFASDPSSGLTNVVGTSPFTHDGTKQQIRPAASDNTQRIVIPSGQTDQEGAVFIARVYNDQDFSGGQTARNPIVVLKYLDNNNFLYAQLDSSQPRYDIRKKDGGVDSLVANLASDANIAAPNTNRNAYMRAKLVGNVITIDVFTSGVTPAQGTSPRNGNAPFATTTYTLTGGNATKFGSGVAGKVGFGYKSSNPGCPAFRDLTFGVETEASAGSPTRMHMYDDVRGNLVICASDLTSGIE